MKMAVDGCITDGAALVKIKTSTFSQTYAGHCKLHFSKKVKIISSKVQQTEIIFEVYKNKSRKREAREKRGKGKAFRILIKKNVSCFKKTNDVMTFDEDKSDLFMLIADTLVKNFQQRR